MAKKPRKTGTTQAVTYRYANSTTGYGVPASVAGAELDRLRAEGGGKLTSSAVVDAARPDDAPLHPAFEWDDAAAAERYRQHQASTLIRAVVVQRDAATPEHRAYVLTRPADEPKPVYVRAEDVAQDASLFADAIERLERIVSQAQRSAAELRDLAERENTEPERMARIALAMQALQAAGAAVAALH